VFSDAANASTVSSTGACTSTFVVVSTLVLHDASVASTRTLCVPTVNASVTSTVHAHAASTVALYVFPFTVTVTVFPTVVVPVIVGFTFSDAATELTVSSTGA
jgi:hypothetical protein